jgi:septal ring factor EnvC (AmiA/AmiB activator)
MGVAAYNRGSRRLAIEADQLAPVSLARSERQAHKDEAERLRARVADLERDLKRARRCIAAQRFANDALSERLREADRVYHFSVRTLCRLAFPGDASPAHP